MCVLKNNNEGKKGKEMGEIDERLTRTPGLRIFYDSLSLSTTREYVHETIVSLVQTYHALGTVALHVFPNLEVERGPVVGRVQWSKAWKVLML